MSSDIKQTVFDILPGLDMPYSQVSHTLSEMWKIPAEAGQQAPSEFRASQMNLVIQFGLKTSLEKAQQVFNTAVVFGQRYPCRIFILCPMGRARSEKLLKAKLFSQCYIGTDVRDMCCCEALILGYPTREADFITDVISVWLENDLPVFLWLNKVPARRVNDMHMSLINQSNRVIYDSSEEGDAYESVHWPKQKRVIDLANARILPVRQSIGQFLSSFKPDVLISDLQCVTVRTHQCYEGEAKNLLKWCKVCLLKCAQRAKQELEVKFELSVETADVDNCIEMVWNYKGSKRFSWTHKERGCDVNVKADFGEGKLEVPMQVQFLPDDKALGEALFFS